MLSSEIYLDANAVGAAGRVWDGDAFEGDALHFLLGAGVGEGEANEAFHVGDGVFVVGEGGGGGGFAHGAGLVEADHVAVEWLLSHERRAERGRRERRDGEVSVSTKLLMNWPRHFFNAHIKALTG